MSTRTVRLLGAGFNCEIDSSDEQTWDQLVLEFEDGNIYQTWPYGDVVAGRGSSSHLILRSNGEVVAIAQARIKSLPLVSLGIAYVQWGPVWRRTGSKTNVEVFRQALRALRNEFVCKRGLSLRLFPMVFENDSAGFDTILAEEGFASIGEETRGRTILMDLTPSLPELKEGLGSHWKRELKVAVKNNLEFAEGSSDELFERFIGMYKEMVSRKKFVEPNDIYQFKLIQTRLPEPLKMRVLLCSSAGSLCAGAIYSRMGNSAIYLFGATSNIGMKSRGSYFLQWKMVEALKQQRAVIYNLNGINPDKNPGTYKFKNDLAGKHGRDVFYAGRFEVHAGWFSQSLVQMGDSLRMERRKFRQRILDARSAKPEGEPQNNQNSGSLVPAPDKTRERQVSPAGREAVHK
jgi:lipid II:glycine glycyltransferase (peptidoglycan interpeptide bridge formation enzyme)